MSQAEVNKMMRVLSGERRKFTVRIHKADGSVIEFQSDVKPVLKYNDEARALWVQDASYDGAPIVPWSDGMVILCEPNPEP